MPRATPAPRAARDEAHIPFRTRRAHRRRLTDKHRTTMNTSDFETSAMHDDDRFDAQARQAHAAAQDALSPRVRAQLQQRRRAALAGPRRASGPRWVPTLTLAATLALAVGLGLRFWAPATPGPAPDAMARGGPDRSSGAQAAASTAATAETPPDAGPRGDATPPQVAAAGDDARGLASGIGSEDMTATAAGASAGVEAEVDAIAALLAVPAAGEAGTAVDEARDAAAVDVGQDDALLAALEESPDFYLWLGADDGADVEAL